MKNKKIKTKGFTLIELMVATSIFVMIMLASMGSLFVLLDAASNSKALRFSMDNVNFAMESMSRSIRMGKNYVCVSDPDYDINLSESIQRGVDCSEGGTLLAFNPQGVTDSSVAYKIHNREDLLDTRTLQKCTKDGCVEVVSSNINVTKLKFFTKGSDDPNIQASVYIMMEGTVLVKEEEVSFSLSTLASMRNL